MPSRTLILASVLLFVNGCDYSQKKPETAFGGVDPSAGGAVAFGGLVSTHPPVIGRSSRTLHAGGR
jgi:hypothetical protein